MKTSYIAFLRAVNVGGRVVSMQRLRALFEELGLSNVRSYIQSGNVFFDVEGSGRNRAALARRIEAHLEEALGYEVPVMLRTAAEVEATLAAFAGDPPSAAVRHCVLFVQGKMPDAPKLPLHAEKHGFSLLKRTEGEVFVVVHVGEGRERRERRMGNPAAFVERTFGVKATARFLHTTKKILDAAAAEAPPRRAR